MWKLKLFVHFHLLSQLKAYLFQTLKLFTHRTPMRPTHPLWIASTHFHPKIMKNIPSSIETCFFMILHENINLWIHVQNFSFLVEISPYAHEIDYSVCMTSLSVLESTQLRFARKVVIKYKTS